MSDSPFSKAAMDRLVAQSLRESPPAIEQQVENYGPEAPIEVEEYGPPARKHGPRMATLLNILAPLADGASTAWAMNQSGPNARIVESNPIYGKNPSAGKIMGIKASQAAIMGLLSHFGGGEGNGRGAAKVSAGINAATGGYATAMNIKNGLLVKKLNNGVKD